MNRTQISRILRPARNRPYWTALHFVFSFLAMICLVRGWQIPAALLIAASAGCDLLFGSTFGIVYKGKDHWRYIHIITRKISDGILMLGFIFYYKNHGTLGDTVLSVSFFTMLYITSYVKARAESLSLRFVQGWLEGPIPYLILGLTGFWSFRVAMWPLLILMFFTVFVDVFRARNATLGVVPDKKSQGPS